MSRTAISSTLRGNMGVMIFTSGIWTLAGQLVWPFQTLYILYLGGTYFEVGLVSSIGALAGLLPTLYGGYLADTIGRKKIIASMSFILSFNALIFAFARDWRWLVLGSVLNSIASGLRQPSFSSIIDDATNPESRAQSYALWQILPPLFGLASPYLMGVYMERNDVGGMLRIGYLVLFLASTIASVIRLYMLEETMQPQVYEINFRTLTAKTLESIKSTIFSLSRTLWVLGLMGFFFGLGAAIGGPFWITYATEDVIGLSLSQWGIITTANTVIGTIIGVPLAMVADRKSRLTLLYPSILLTPLAIIAFIYCKTFQQTLIISLIITTLGSMGMSSGQALFTDQTKAENRGRINSLWSLAGTMQAFSVGVSPGSILGATGNLIGGYLYQTTSKALPLYIQSGLVAITAITALLFLKNTFESR